METDKKNEKKKGMDGRDWKWLISILIGINILILTLRLGDNMDVVNLFSFISSAVSIALALVAILIALNQSRDNEELSSTLKVTMAIINEKLNSVDEKVNKIDPDVLSRVLQQKIDNVITEIKEGETSESGDNPQKVKELYNDELNQLKYELPLLIKNLNEVEVSNYVSPYMVGDRVLHKKWGLGEVVDVKGQGNMSEVHIIFDQPIGKKVLVAKYAPLKRVA